MNIMLLLLSSVLLMSCSVLGKRTADEPGYSVVKKDGAFEIREYDSMIIAETLLDGSYRSTSGKGFSKLAKFIFGSNVGSEKIAMTAPVLQEAEGEKISMTAPVIQEKAGTKWKMGFVMPAEYTLQNLPKPVDPEIVIREVPARKVATVRYSGLHSEKNIGNWSSKLTEWLDKQGVKAVSVPRAASYDPPWTVPFLRRNEIHIDVL